MMNINKTILHFIKRKAGYLLLPLALLSISACTVTPYKSVENIDNVKAESIILVGKFELDPPFKKDEQSFPLTMTFKDMYINKLVGGLAEKSDDQKGSGAFFNPKLGELFFLEIPRSKRYLAQATIMRKITSKGRMTKLVLPTPIDFGIKPNDKAVYIGTMKVTRDEFQSIIATEVIDDHKQAQKAFQKKFSTKETLRKSLMKSPQ